VSNGGGGNSNINHSKSSASLGAIKIPKLDFSKLKTSSQNQLAQIVVAKPNPHKKKSSFIEDTDDQFDSSLGSGDDFKIDESPIHPKMADTK
jgi:hypothetical protein